MNISFLHQAVRLLIASALSCAVLGLVSPPAEAQRLKRCRGAGTQEQPCLLKTDTANPRIIIDIPGVRLGTEVVNQWVSAPIRYVRVAQFTADTTRVVIELSSAYRFKRSRVRFGELDNPRRIFVDLPNAQLQKPETQVAIGGGVYRVRAEQHTPSIARVVVDVDTPPGVFAQTPPTLPAPPQPAPPSPPTSPRTPETQKCAIALPSVPRNRYTVVIDPGHGGPDPGAVGIGGLQEKGITLSVSKYIQACLEQQGVNTILTRTVDMDLDLPPRVAIAENQRADLFVSIHANAVGGYAVGVNGAETFYYESPGFAQTVHSSIISVTGIGDRGVKAARFYVIRNTSMPSILVETGFVTGSIDAAKLRDDGFRRKMGAAIARGILNYLAQ